MKKIILLISLIVILSNCGGGGGGGESPQTNAATPQIPGPQNPSQPITPIVNNPIAPNNSIPNNTPNNNVPNNSISNNPLPNNPVPDNSYSPKNDIDSDIPKNTGNPTGQGVKVGVLDNDFVSGSDTTTSRFYRKSDFHGLLYSGTPYDEVITKEFGNRLTVIEKNQGRPGKDDHGLIVATILAGNSGKGAKEASVYGVSFGEPGGKLIVDVEKYRELQNQGVRIYNQSFGTILEFSKYTVNDYKNYLYSSVLRGEATVDELNRKVDELMNFYRTAVSEGSLFIWAAGNTKDGRTELNAPTIQAGLPHFIPSLYKGWIAVVGVRPDGSEYAPHLARAGGAMYWTIAANGNCELTTCSDIGSSFAAPRVTSTAVKVKERFPWMSGHEIKQTILTTAKDIGYPGIDPIFGWGLLDEEKALKGPAQFNKELIVGENAARFGAEARFKANIPDKMTSIFENDISGLGGLEKSGKGTLILTGNNTYSGITYVQDGKLSIYRENGSNIQIFPQGTVVTHSKTIIGLRNYKGDFIPVNVNNNGGTFENQGSGAVITGNYTATGGSVTKAEIGTKLTVKGTVNLNGENVLLQAVKDKYITAKPLSETIIEAEKGINGNFSKVDTPELINGSSEVAGNNLTVTLSRKNVEEYVSSLENSDEMRKNVAENIEASFKELDSQIEKGYTPTSFAKSAALIQKMSLPNSSAILDSLSGQIYASAQALTFQQSQTVNKDLSNRLVMLGTLDNLGDNAGIWVTGIGSAGKLRKEGYGEGRTHVYGGQAGIDRLFGNNMLLGAAISYSKSDVKFDRYGGESKGTSFGLSLYGRVGNKEVPYYLQGRIGIGFVDSDVERDIVLGSGSVTRAKINHDDKVYSGYIEGGYDFKNNGFTLTPFIGLSHDTVVRGSFREENSQFGLSADKARYHQTSGLVGMRIGKKLSWRNGRSTTLQGYVTHQMDFREEDLSFEASYTGLSGAKFRVKGIGLPKNRTWAGIGLLTEVNPMFSWYVNYDAKIEKSRVNNNVFTTGFRFNF